MENSIGREIFLLREKKGLTQGQLAERIPGLRQKDISEIENGKRQPTARILQQIANALGHIWVLQQRSYENMDLAIKDTVNSINFMPRGEEKLWIRTSRNTYESIKVSDIMYVEAYDHYLKITIKVRNGPILFRSSLKSFHENIVSVYPAFFRLTRSHIVNLQFIERIEGNLIFIGDQRFPIPKKNRFEFLEKLNLI